MERLAESSAGINHLVPLARAANTYKGSGFDASGCLGVLFQVAAGDIAAGGTLNVKIQESDTDSDLAYADITGAAIAQLGDTGDNSLCQIDVRVGGLAAGTRKKYLRAYAVVAGNTVCFAVIARKYDVQAQPVVNTPATVYV